MSAEPDHLGRSQIGDRESGGWGALVGFPARYRPYSSGRYDVAPALRPLGTPFGNGEVDGQALQLDCDFPEFRANKIVCLAERPGKYSGCADHSPAVAAAVLRFLVSRMTDEYPALFRAETTESGGTALHSRLTEETLILNDEMHLDGVTHSSSGAPSYRDAFEALCCQVQEDVAVVSTSPDGRNWLSAYHVSAPSHWRPEEKAGHDFAAIHAPVPHMEPINRVASAMADAMVNRGPFVRFVWGIETSRELNRHPDAPPGVSAAAWKSPPLDRGRPSPFLVRVERQVIWGLPEVGASVFLIRPYRTEAALLTPEERRQLRSGILSMSPESLAYKGIAGHAEELVEWLETRDR